MWTDKDFARASHPRFRVAASVKKAMMSGGGARWSSSSFLRRSDFFRLFCIRITLRAPNPMGSFFQCLKHCFAVRNRNLRDVPEIWTEG